MHSHAARGPATPSEVRPKASVPLMHDLPRMGVVDDHYVAPLPQGDRHGPGGSPHLALIGKAVDDQDIHVLQHLRRVYLPRQLHPGTMLRYEIPGEKPYDLPTVVQNRIHLELQPRQPRRLLNIQPEGIIVIRANLDVYRRPPCACWYGGGLPSASRQSPAGSSSPLPKHRRLMRDDAANAQLQIAGNELPVHVHGRPVFGVPDEYRILINIVLVDRVLLQNVRTQLRRQLLVGQVTMGARRATETGSARL